MGTYLNPGNENFKSYIDADIYVDKTMIIDITNRFIDKSNKYVCVSHPRRFGKTMASNTLNAYYSKGCDSRELFAPFKIAETPGFEDKLNKYNVIKIDMNSEYQGIADKSKIISTINRDVRSEIIQEFSDAGIEDDDTIARCIQKVYAATGETFIILMDEYDVLVREEVPQSLFDEYLSFLNSLFKSDTLRPAIALAYITGILPIVRDKVQSKLNNFEEYTALDTEELSGRFGFTEEELKALCDEHGIEFEECRRWYDGYRQNEFEVYNPESVVKAVRKKKFGSYWGKTSTYKAISERIQQNFAGTRDSVIQMLAGEEVDVNVTRYMNTMTSFHTKDDLFTYLLHLGYLAYNADGDTCRIPNKEVRQEWFNAIETDPEYAVTDEIIKASKALLTETWKFNEEAVAKALDRSHIHVTSNRSYNNEDALQSAIYLAYIYALNRYTVVKEMTAGKGFADVVFIPFIEGDPAMIIELKRNDCAESAINQINDRQYFDSLEHYSGALLFVGINYDEKDKTHSCKIERFEK